MKFGDSEGELNVEMTQPCKQHFKAATGQCIPEEYLKVCESSRKDMHGTERDRLILVAHQVYALAFDIRHLSRTICRSIIGCRLTNGVIVVNN